MCLLQGVKAEQMEAATKSLEARLQASEQTTELIKTFSSPQVSAAVILHSPPPPPHLTTHSPLCHLSPAYSPPPHSPNSIMSCPHTHPSPPHSPHSMSHPRTTPSSTSPTHSPHSVTTSHSITSHPRTPLLYILHHISTIHSPRAPHQHTPPLSPLTLSPLHPTLPHSYLSTQLSRSPYR